MPTMQSDNLIVMASTPAPPNTLVFADGIYANQITAGSLIADSTWSYAIDLVSVLEGWSHAGISIRILILNSELYGKYGTRTARFEIQHEPLLDMTDQPFQVRV